MDQIVCISMGIELTGVLGVILLWLSGLITCSTFTVSCMTVHTQKIADSAVASFSNPPEATKETKCWSGANFQDSIWGTSKAASEQIT